VAKGKDHKQYEYGSKASIASTAQGNLIVGVVSHEQNLHDSHTLPAILHHVEVSRGKAAKQAVCDRGYRGKWEVNGTRIVLPGKALKQDNRYQRDKKRKQCKRRAAIEPIHWPFKIRLPNGKKLPERRNRRLHQSSDGCLRLEFETMVAGHFFGFFFHGKNTQITLIS